MKKRTKAILSGILVLSILAGTPICMETAEAAGQKAADRVRTAASRWELAPRYPDWGERQEAISEVHSEERPDELSEGPSEVWTEKISEKMSEEVSEQISEEVSQEVPQEISCEESESISEVFSEDLSENMSESASEDSSENFSESISEEISETNPERTEPLSLCDIAVEISDGGELDYRTYMDTDAELRIAVREPETTKTAAETDNDEPIDVQYKLKISNTNIVDFGEVDGTVIYKKSLGTLTTSESRIPLKICSVGKTKYTLEVSAAGAGSVSRSGSIRVNNSPLHESDFYIELSRDGQVEQYEYDAWLTYLENCKEWVSGKVEVKLTDTGMRYYNAVRMRTQKADGSSGNAPDKAMKKYTFWAEHSDRKASTKNVEGGTRSFTAGIDTDAPALTSLSMESKYYEPTKTDTEQYFAEDVILKGSFDDDISGVSRIEYTTDFHSEQDTLWMEAANASDSAAQTDTRTDFRITLPDGIYPAIAVRAYDAAGNVSAVSGYVNDAGEYIKVVADRSAPVLEVHAASDGLPYSGESDNWTNKDVRMDITFDKGSCPYAGIDRCEYAYQKIGEDMTEVSEQWTALSVREDLSAGLVVTEDKNGYFLFRAVSKSGIMTEEAAKQRILVQHQAAEIKPLVISGADETKCRDGWYNKQSGTPVIRFAYPDYDTGVISKEYDAPVTVHYRLTKETSVPESAETETPKDQKDTPLADRIEKNAVIGIMSSEDMTVRADGGREFVLTKDDLNRLTVDFGYNKDSNGAQDGIYTLEYWITDKAGNESKRQIYSYKIDCHEPTDLTIELDGSALAVGEKSVITYERFYQESVSGSADAQYGISGKGSLKVMKAKRIGEWKDRESDSLEDADSISITPNTRCFLYVRAEDQAGNTAEGWTDGIVVDNMAPNETDGGKNRELIIEPKGANRHGFFNENVTIAVRVADAPENDNCAALRSVTSSIGKDGADTVTDRELFSFTKESPTEDEMTAAAEFQCTQLIDAKANESNEAYIEVTAADRSDNVKTSTQLLKIDVTKPEIDISFDNNDAANGSFYRQGRVATVHVHELNFDPAAVSVVVTKDGQDNEVSLSGWTSDGSEHYAGIAFDEDGDYRISASCVDLADNASEEVQSEAFTIDRTAPEITISLRAGQDMQLSDRDCFNMGITAVVTVTEHNFRAEDFIVNMTPVSEKGTWSHEGDVHTLHISFAGDNAYRIACTYADMAGNPANTVEKDFIIDTASPVIAIEGVADGSANSGAVLPVISVFDRNINLSDISVSVTTGIGDAVENTVGIDPLADENEAGFRLTLTDMTDKPDNIYHLAVSARDRAGNETKRTCRFSLNRNGSVYDLTSLMRLMDRQYNTYSGLDAFQIVEMNIDTVEEFELYVSRNGAIGYKAEYTKEVSGSADVGYTYLYQIKKENFAEEGTYRLSLYSRDRAGNEVNNAADIHGNEISFVIDNTAPKVVIDGVESGMVYDVEAQEIHVCVADNFKLAEAQFMLINKANEVLDSWDYMELAGEDKELNITIPQYNEEISLLYRVKDAAGNEMQTFRGEQTALVDFLVTTDRLVQFINKPSRTPFGRVVLFMTGMSVITVLSVAVLLLRRRNVHFHR